MPAFRATDPWPALRPLLLSLLLLSSLAGYAQIEPDERPASMSLERHSPAQTPWSVTMPTPPNHQFPLLIVDGRILPDTATAPPAEEILAMRELEPEEAVAKYGTRARHGALIIDTRKRPRRSRR